MKKIPILLGLALAAGCQKNDPAADEFEAQTQGRRLSCGKPLVTVKDSARVAQLIGSPLSGPTYVALQLDTALLSNKNQTLLLRIRRPTTEEQRFSCNAMYLARPALTVVSARLK